MPCQEKQNRDVQYSNAEIGQQIAQMCERWHPEHQSVRDRVLLLARRLNML